jgi:beta-exotoxin I transport system ATP-binding protein
MSALEAAARNLAITSDRLTKRFPKVTAVSELSIEVRHGEICGFLGPNGAGKTTTIRMLLGFLRPTAGSCSVLGGWLWREAGVRRRVGYLPGDFRIDSAMSGAQLFTWFGRLRGNVDQRRLRGLIDRLDLDPTRPFGSLSKGNRQKVGLVQAFMHDPEVLILDEPTTSLDPLVQREFLRMLRESTERGAAVLFSTHVLPEIERIASRVAIIRSGRLVTMSSVDSLLDRARHRLQFRFTGAVDRKLFEGVPGVIAAEVDGQTATITIDGPEGPALQRAASAPGLLRVSAAGDDLEDLFLSLYDRGSGR